MNPYIQALVCGFLFAGSLHAATNQEPCENPCTNEPCLGGGSLTKSQACYNAPATPKLNCPRNIFATGSFLYWHTSQEGMALASTSTYTPSIGRTVPLSSGSKIVFQDFEYTPGFSAGIGTIFGEDQWNLSLEWTRLHKRVTTSQLAPNLDSNGSFSLSGWAYQVSNTNQPIGATSLRSTWSLDLDWIDLILARPFYRGIWTTVNSFTGIRASRIDQILNIDLSGIRNNPNLDSLNSFNASNSWAIGPRGGVEGRALLGGGFRLQGGCGGSLLYTRYTTLKHTETPVSSTELSYPDGITYTADPISALKPMVEASLGLGWGGCPSSKNWHFDLSAVYEFNHLWSQNMLSVLNNWSFISSSTSPGGLSFHGLTLKGTVQY